MTTLLSDELLKASYATSKEANAACTIFKQLIVNRSEFDPIYLWEFMNLANASCSVEFTDYAWINMDLRTALVNGDIYTYTGNRDYKWHINVPDPYILEVI